VSRLRIQRALLTASLMMFAPALANAQQAPAAAATQQQLEALFQEFQQVHLQLESIQIQALQDPALAAAQEQLGQEIRQAMESTDPSLPQKISRIEALESEAMNAQQTGDANRLQQLMVEAQQIEEHFMTVQQQVLESPAIASKVSAFQTQLETKMKQVNPQTETLITRFRTLETQLASAMGGA
jgi:hypothetical protein